MDFELLPHWAYYLWLERTLSPEDFYNNPKVAATIAVYKKHGVYGSLREQIITFEYETMIPNALPYIMLGGIDYRQDEYFPSTLSAHDETLHEFFGHDHHTAFATNLNP